MMASLTFSCIKSTEQFDLALRPFSSQTFLSKSSQPFHNLYFHPHPLTGKKLDCEQSDQKKSPSVYKSCPKMI